MYTFTSKVRYSETDMKGRLSIPAIINYFQDCSNFQSTSLGVGIEYLMKINRAWVLISWNVEFEKELVLGDEIVTSTWSRGINKFYAYRNFTIKDKNGQICARADTVWVYIDLETRHPLKITDEEINVYGIEPGLDMPAASRKMKLPPVTGEGEPVKIRKMHLDTNGHVNNAQYIAMAMDYIPEDFNAKSMKVVYIKEAMLHDTLFPHIHETQDSIFISFMGEDNALFVSIEFIRRN
ncbi:MAG: acyl-[acyl-carrier-protein] thioesterase [Eubacterium sp.]